MSNDDEQMLRTLVERFQAEPFIRHIRFPHFKNLAKDTRVEFSFPITALVGANGTNKSSILRAIQGAPGNENLGNYWFSTKIDPIEETGDRPNCFIYGYRQETTKHIVEVLKTRVRKAKDPDYWEPSRAILSYGMIPKPQTSIPTNKGKTRWDAIKKNVVYIDFRQSLSAFDKAFYHSERKSAKSTKELKDFIRTRAPHLKNAINKTLKSLIYHRTERITGENRKLSRAEVDIISYILGRSYSEIRWVQHRFFNTDAYTCVLSMGQHSYTEAFAGSGEFAVARLVIDVLKAKKTSLILLDEPEVSLHPGAQERLMQFLRDQAKRHKHQIVISTHSPTIIRDLPKDAIKVFILDPASGKVKIPSQSADPEEAFFYLGEPIFNVKTIVVEDELAKGIIQKAIRKGGEPFSKRFNIKTFPGGAKTLWTQYIPIFAAENRSDICVFLDGDERPHNQPLDPASIPASDENAVWSELQRVSRSDIKLYVDGGAGGGNNEQLNMARRNLLSWIHRNVKYLPGNVTPEEFIWTNMKDDEHSNSITDPNFKEKFVKLTHIELGKSPFEQVSSNEILQTQLRRLATIKDNNADIEALFAEVGAF